MHSMYTVVKSSCWPSVTFELN
uniref:Uncharacterized protein n=1 Tax=Arundo donax TaxID=35708 RepID=A0A0A8Y200_ARUDO